MLSILFTWPAFLLNPGLLGSSILAQEPSTTLMAYQPPPLHIANGEESFSYRVGWGIFPRAATLHIRLAEKNEDRQRIWHLETEVATSGMIRTLYPLQQESTTRLQAPHGLFLDSSTRGSVRNDQMATRTWFDWEEQTVYHRDTYRPHRNREGPIENAFATDFLTSLFKARSLPLAADETFLLWVQGDGEFHPLRLRVVEHRSLSATLGTYEAFCLQAEMLEDNPIRFFERGGSIRVWISDDAARLPLQMEVQVRYGTAIFHLERYESGGLILEQDISTPTMRRRGRR